MTDVVNSEANVWTPEFNSVVSSNTKRVEETQLAIQGQTLFNLRTFSYATNTGSLAVYIDGLLQSIKLDWNEVNPISFSLNTGANAGAKVTAVAWTEISGIVPPDPTNPTFVTVKLAHDTNEPANGNVVISYTTDLTPVVEYRFDDPTGAKSFSWFTIDGFDVEQQFGMLAQFFTLPSTLADLQGAPVNVATTKEYVDSVATPGGTGPFVAAPGSAGAPAFTFVGGLDDGIFSTTPGALNFATEGVARMTLSAFGIAMLGAIDLGGNQIQNVLAPTVGGEVGDRDYNDARYQAIGAGAGPGIAVAGGHITSDGVGAQDITNCYGVASVIISGAQFIITLLSAVTGPESMIINFGQGAGIGTRNDTMDQTSTTTLAYDVVVNGSPTIAALAQFHFTIHDAGA